MLADSRISGLLIIVFGNRFLNLHDVRFLSLLWHSGTGFVAGNLEKLSILRFLHLHFYLLDFNPDLGGFDFTAFLRTFLIELLLELISCFLQLEELELEL